MVFGKKIEEKSVWIIIFCKVNVVFSTLTVFLKVSLFKLNFDNQLISQRRYKVTTTIIFVRFLAIYLFPSTVRL